MVPVTKFNNGVECPLVGLGTWKSKPEDVIRAVKIAIDIGYRHIDCAPLYDNEKDIGEGIRAKIEEGVVKREDLFITSKLWNTHHHPDAVETALRNSMRNLKVDYLDLYLIHWPCGFKESTDSFPQNEDGSVAFSDVDYLETWMALEKMHKKGLVRAIGVSNFNKRQIERILENCAMPPAVNQVESSPYLNQAKLMGFCKANGITLTAYSPLGSPDRPNYKAEDPNLFDDDTMKTLSRKYNRSIAQIALRYQVQRGVIVIPKSVTKARLEENIKVFDFVIGEDDMEVLNKMDCNYRTCKATRCYTHKYHPFINDEY